MLDPDVNNIAPIRKHRLGIILLVYGFRSLALSMFKEAALLSNAELTVLEKALSNIPLHKKLKNAWLTFPYKVWPLLRRLGLFRVQ
jgi:hypothetical protein